MEILVVFYGVLDFVSINPLLPNCSSRYIRFQHADSK